LNEKKSLRANWHADGDSWDQTQLLDAALQAISMSDAHPTIDLAKTALNKFGYHPTSQYYLALAYANCGSREEVFGLVDVLMASVKPADNVYVAALSLVGRLEKDKYIRELGHEAADTALANALERLQ